MTASGILLQQFSDWRTHVSAEEVAEFRAVMDRMAERSREIYQDLVHRNASLFELFRVATPIDELANARFGSRPAYRPGAKEGIEGIRAIPWGFGWTQIRLMLTGWLGVGKALSEESATPDGLARLQSMAKKWPFFDDLLGKIDMVCAKTDIEIARTYVNNLGGDQALFASLAAEFETTVSSLLRIRNQESLLDDNRVLQDAIALRNPYVDPLSLLQISLLRRKRRKKEAGASQEQIEDALATTLSGIAQGLRNTG